MKESEPFADDHSYSRATEAKGCQETSDHNYDIEPNFSSTPTKAVENVRKANCLPFKIQDHSSILGDSFESVGGANDDHKDMDFTFKDDSLDPSFSIESLTDENEEEETDINQEQIYLKQQKFTGFESCIEILLHKLKYDTCSCPVDPDSTVKNVSDGT
jgi:hypothetical protein